MSLETANLTMIEEKDDDGDEEDANVAVVESFGATPNCT